jgi:pSer/pThr/pTyr-binding forkhead associated (FHA) protein
LTAPVAVRTLVTAAAAGTPTQTVAGPSAAMADRVQSLIVKDATGAERVVPVDREVITVGRHPTCTIRLDSPYVSRQHARFELRPDGLMLEDLGGRNGTLLNGEPLAGRVPVMLSAGDIVTIADATIECLADAAADGTTRTLVRERAQPPPADLLRVDAQAYTVWIGDSQIQRPLSPQEFELLRYLYEHRDRVCTRQELGDAIWGTGNWDTNMLHRLVHRLKDKLEPNPEKPRYVQTVPWIGYRVTP